MMTVAGDALLSNGPHAAGLSIIGARCGHRRSFGMPKARAPTRPTTATLKRLFALSGNRCAFRRCQTSLVEGDILVGEVYHIKGRKRGVARYDAKQSSPARRGFGNLLLLCPTHHTIIEAKNRSSFCCSTTAASNFRRASASKCQSDGTQTLPQDLFPR
jgi:hypothetical protein